jgi:hypothetical protein
VLQSGRAAQKLHPVVLSQLIALESILERNLGIFWKMDGEGYGERDYDAQFA